jgi:proteasome beta subunit
MGLPLFRVTEDPGPSFLHYVEAAGLTFPVTSGNGESAHATTVVAVRYVGGVVMVGDRQATGNYIASRDVRKIEPADRFTAIAMSGSAARGLEFIRMAQLSFEHYEKMTDAALSLEGKANYLSPIIQRNNLTTPLTVLPLLAGWDSSHQVGRIYEYDGAGGCYERLDFATIGSGSPFADGALRLGFRTDLDLEGALDLGALALYEAGDNDPSTGGPDFVRDIYPMIVVIDAEGYRELDLDDVAARFRAINERRARSAGVPGGTLR